MGLPVGGTALTCLSLFYKIILRMLNNFRFLCPTDALICVPSKSLKSIRPVDLRPKNETFLSFPENLIV